MQASQPQRPRTPVLATRAATEAPEFAKVTGGLATRFAVVAMQTEDPFGADRLRTLVGLEPLPA